MSLPPNGPILTPNTLGTPTGHVYGGTGQEQPDKAKLGPLVDLIGRWTSNPGSTDGFSVMPLPQVEKAIDPSDDVILKNFHYYEEMDLGFVGRVPNRGGRFTQNAYALLYEQRVTISDGPDEGVGVHAENGTWLHFITEPQLIGPYGDPDPDQHGNQHLPAPPAPPDEYIPSQDPSRLVAKQVSVPHGNSLLAVGRYSEVAGPPVIPDVSTLPIGATGDIIDRYRVAPFTDAVANPNMVLRKALDATERNITRTVVLTVSTDNGGNIGNVPFEQRHANVTLFETTFWLEYNGNELFQVQYSQTINIEFPRVAGRVVFPHVTVNTLARAP